MTIAPGLLPEGLRDRLPPQAEAASRVLHRVVVAIGRHGYERVLPPLAEFEEGLVGRLKSARATDLLRVVDPVSQRSLALRPDITAQVGRIATTRLESRPRPLRLAYGGPVMKLRATQLRPERELIQAGAELIGRDTEAAAIECVGVALDALEAAGVTGIAIDITLPDLVDTLAAGPWPLDSEARAGLRAVLDAKDMGGLAAIGAGAYAPLIEAAGPLEQGLARLRAAGIEAAAGQRLAAVERIAAAVGGRARLSIDPAERQGFEYQTWLGFSLFADGLSGEIGRGGTYAVVHPAGREEPATGFSIFVDPLVDAGLGTVAARRLFVPIGADRAAAARARAEGWITVAQLDPADDARALGCTHQLDGAEPVPIPTRSP